MKVLVTGAAGVMGGHVINACKKGLGGSDSEPVLYDIAGGEGIYSSLSDIKEKADIVVDFSNHLGTKAILDYCVENNMPAVIATTGHTPEEKAEIKAASEKIPVFYSGNFSLGIAALVSLTKQAAKLFPDADIEIVEAHHTRKIDAPSGTALMIAEGIKEVRPESTFNVGRSGQGKRTKEEIGIHSLRMGNVVGMHEVIINTGTQALTLKHEAFDRALFAEGGLAAGEFLLAKAPGLYDMADLTA